MKFILKFYNFLEPKWLNDLKKIEQFHKFWSYSSGFGQKSPIICIGNRDMKKAKIKGKKYIIGLILDNLLIQLYYTVVN